MDKKDIKIIYRNPGFSAEDDLQNNGGNDYRIVLGCNYLPLKWKKAVGNNPDNNPKHNFQTVPRR